MIRKGNGYTLQRLHVTKNGMVSEDIGDWDIRMVIEQKVLAEINKTLG